MGRTVGPKRAQASPRDSSAHRLPGPPHPVRHKDGGRFDACLRSRPGQVERILEERTGLQRVEVNLDGHPGARVRADPAHRSRRHGRLGGRQHHCGRPRARDRGLARRALEPGARHLVGAGPGTHHEGPIHELADRRREQRGVLDRPRRRHVDRRDAGGGGRAAQPGARRSRPRSRAAGPICASPT